MNFNQTKPKDFWKQQINRELFHASAPIFSQLRLRSKFKKTSNLIEHSVSKAISSKMKVRAIGVEVARSKFGFYE